MNSPVLHHVSLITLDLDRAIKFYRDVFGLKQIARPLAGMWAGLSHGGVAILATMTASASYIAAPAAVKMALPDANPGLCLTTAISITLPFNIIIGIPLYFALAGALVS